MSIAENTCKVDGCISPLLYRHKTKTYHLQKGYCQHHYYKMWRYGDPLKPTEVNRSNCKGSHTTHKLYKAWGSMKARCYKPNHKAYKYYGAKGIKVCDRWLSDDTNCGFCAFVADVGERPRGMTLDRIDSSGDYSKGNCRWANSYQQNTNLNKKSKLGHRGIQQRFNRFRVSIGYGKMKKYLGSYPTLEDAIEVRIRAEEDYQHPFIKTKSLV